MARVPYGLPPSKSSPIRLPGGKRRRIKARSQARGGAAEGVFAMLRAQRERRLTPPPACRHVSSFSRRVRAPSPRVWGEGRGEGASPLGSESRRRPLTRIAAQSDLSPRSGERCKQNRSRGACAPEFCQATLTKATPQKRSGAPRGARVVGHATRANVTTRSRFGRGARHKRSACANRLLRARGASRRSTAVRAHGCRPPPAGTALAPSTGVAGWRP